MDGACRCSKSRSPSPLLYENTQNSPVTGALGADIYKATNIIRAFRAVGKVAPESGIPAAVLHGAAGFAILSIAKVPDLHVIPRRALCPDSPTRGMVSRLCPRVFILCADASDASDWTGAAHRNLFPGRRGSPIRAHHSQHCPSWSCYDSVQWGYRWG